MQKLVFMALQMLEKQHLQTGFYEIGLETLWEVSQKSPTKQEEQNGKQT